MRLSFLHASDGQDWLVEPRPLGENHTDGRYAGRLWSPGIRTGVKPGSRVHTEEFFGPVLGVMTAPTLTAAIQMQNAVAYGLTAGLYTQNPDDLRQWLDQIEAGNLYVNRGITGAIVRRQPFGGWKRSSVGPGGKAGGPNYLVGLGSWRPVPSGGAGSSATSTLRLDRRVAKVIEAARPCLDEAGIAWIKQGASSDELAWEREFGQVVDVSQLGVERNLFRYRPDPVEIRATGEAPWRSLMRVMVAGLRTGSDLSVSSTVELPSEVVRLLSEAEVPVRVESDATWVQQMAARDRDGSSSKGHASRVRLVGDAEAVDHLQVMLAEASGGDPDLAVYANEVTTASRLELLPFLREQSISITAHRFGNPDRWSEAVI